MVTQHLNGPFSIRPEQSWANAHAATRVVVQTRKRDGDSLRGD
jgi:hypothetical protein